MFDLLSYFTKSDVILLPDKSSVLAKLLATSPNTFLASVLLISVQDNETSLIWVYILLSSFRLDTTNVDLGLESMETVMLWDVHVMLVL